MAAYVDLSIQCLCLEASLKVLESEIRGYLKELADVSKQIWATNAAYRYGSKTC